MKPGYREFLVCVLLVLSAVAAFHGVAGNEFIEIDDPEYITQNPHVTGGLTNGRIVTGLEHPQEYVGAWTIQLAS